MENFMDKLYSKIGAGSGQQYVSDMEQRKRAANESRMEALTNLIRENDSKQLECITAVIAQESEERRLSKAELLQELQNIEVILKQIQTEQSYEPGPVPVSSEIPAERLQDLEEHIHKENVKCYRNVQASVMEQAELQKEETRVAVRPVKGMLIATMILTLANIGVLVAHILGFI